MAVRWRAVAGLLTRVVTETTTGIVIPGIVILVAIRMAMVAGIVVLCTTVYARLSKMEIGLVADGETGA